MHRGRISATVVGAALVVVASLVLAWGRPAAANHNQEEDQLWVTVAINAAGSDRVSVTDDAVVDGRTWSSVAADAAVALGRDEGTFQTHEDYDQAYAEFDEKLAQPSARGGLSWSVDSGNLQLLAQTEGYEVLLLEVCTPRVRQVVNALVTPESLQFNSPGSRCRGWYQFVDDPPIRAEFELSPDRDRYPLAVGRAIGSAAIAFGILGIGATLLRRGPLHRRSAVSWVLGVGCALVLGFAGWTTVTVLMWWNGSANDPMLLSGGDIPEQVARTMLPGLVFLLPALLPAAVLLSAPRKEKPPPPPRPTWPVAAPPAAAWWPQAWWPEWAAQNPQGQPPPTGWGSGPAPGGPPPPPTPPPPGQAAPPTGAPPMGPPPPGGPSSGWAPPGSGGG